jgi:hypothetical protein
MCHATSYVLCIHGLQELLRTICTVYKMVTSFKLYWQLYTPPTLKFKTLHFVHRMYLYVLHDSCYAVSGIHQLSLFNRESARWELNFKILITEMNFMLLRINTLSDSLQCRLFDQTGNGSKTRLLICSDHEVQHSPFSVCSFLVQLPSLSMANRTLHSRVRIPTRKCMFSFFFVY